MVASILNSYGTIKMQDIHSRSITIVMTIAIKIISKCNAEIYIGFSIIGQP